VKFTVSDQLASEDANHLLHEKSSPAVTSPFLQADQHTSSQQEETFLSESSSEDEAADMNYTLMFDMAVSESKLDETVAGTGRESVVDAAVDISKFPSKNDL